jgi:hypothetical protein
MPTDEYVNCAHNQQEFEASETSLVSCKRFGQSFCCLCQPEARSEVHGKRSSEHSSEELLKARRRGFAGLECEPAEEK